jgi:hypothetical protein
MVECARYKLLGAEWARPKLTINYETLRGSQVTI